jgi:DNA polymerase-4
MIYILILNKWVMIMDVGRAILHSDLNSFYASVETMLDPSLRSKAVAVCGSTQERHGIVLAKSDKAKKAGVKTGMVNWQAKQVCPELILVPPQYDEYIKYSKLVRAIYQRYTDKVEPYGMDECWLDVTGSQGLFGSAEEIAHEIRNTIREELGMTVSIGVSFNKVFAKLGSDMKKPDAVTVLTPENYKQVVWALPASDLLYVGPSTTRTLSRYGILKIGDLAQVSPELLRQKLGVNGVALWVFANGEDTARVAPDGVGVPVKTIGHGTTCSADLTQNSEVYKILLMLAQDVGHRLRVHEAAARGVAVSLRDTNLETRQYQARLPWVSRSPLELAECAMELVKSNYTWNNPLRSVTIRAITLENADSPRQIDLDENVEKRIRRDVLETHVERIRERFGMSSITPAALIGHGTRSLMSEMKIPGQMAR